MSLAVQEIEPGVMRLAMSGWRGRAVGYEVSAYLLDGVLVDSGFPGARRALLGAVKALAPRGAVITHWHEDHSGNAPALARLGLPLLMHPQCEATLRARPRIGAYRRFVWGRTEPFREGVTVFDVAPLEVVATPGHTADHLVVWDAERRIVASGDLFLGVKVRVAHLHESPLGLVRSLRAIAALEPRILLDAHRGVVENATAMLRAKVAWLEDTMGEVHALAASGYSERAIQRRVLGREPLVGLVSVGEYSKRSLVRAILREEPRQN
ncbi:MAG: MBL fold metallo-hydrolase [Polaromonas sp.]|nr:MBL fold metallo-hydrolase [Gemmatimonadaceae bacterium]